MKQVVEFRFGFDEEIFGPNDNIEEVLEFLKKAGVDKRVSIKVFIDNK